VIIMNLNTIFVAVALLAAVIAVALVFLSGKDMEDKKLTPLASLAFGFIIAGIYFGRTSLYAGYSCIAIGVLLSIVDIYMKSKKKH